MEFRENVVSSSYGMLYLTLTKEEVNLILSDSIRQYKKYYIDKKQLELKITSKIYNNKVSSSSKIIDKINKEINDLNNDIYSRNFMSEVMSLIHENLDLLMEEEIESRGKIIIGQKKLKAFGALKKNNPFTLVCSFCYVNNSYKLILPTIKTKEYHLSDEDTQALLNEILLKEGYYTSQKTETITEFSDLSCEVIYNDDIENENKRNISATLFDINELCDTIGIRNTDVISENKREFDFFIDNDKITLKILDVYEKTIMPLTDDIVKKINVFSITKKEDFINKIKEVYDFVLNVNMSVVNIVRNIAKINDFKIDKYVKEHFAKDISDDANKNKKIIMFNDTARDNIRMQFVTAIIFKEYYPSIEKYYKEIEEEFTLLKVLKTDSFENKDLETFIEYRRPFIVLYDYFKLKKIL